MSVASVKAKLEMNSVVEVCDDMALVYMSELAPRKHP